MIVLILLYYCSSNNGIVAQLYIIDRVVAGANFNVHSPYPYLAFRTTYLYYWCIIVPGM